MYFLIPLTETKDETREAVPIHSILRGDTGETEELARENNEHNANLNGGTYEDSVSLNNRAFVNALGITEDI